MRLPDPNLHYPPRWDDYDRIAPDVFRFGEFRSATLVNRFGARYRLAKAFRGLELEGYTPETERGYVALVRLMLAWSAFDALLAATGGKSNERALTSLEARYDSAGWQAALRCERANGGFFRLVLEHLNVKPLREEVARHLAGTAATVLSLIKAARHVFVHGWLTPNVNGCEPASVVAVCEALISPLVYVMDMEFTQRVNAILAELEPPRPPNLPGEEWPLRKEWPHEHGP